ncbi:coagulation factor V-like [Amphiura filiformis]|uniref:coagulation factor V-like n=1 Tax=Amphiura filiformis TaxID=82378 RepID=UPI003B21F6F6
MNWQKLISHIHGYFVTGSEGMDTLLKGETDRLQASIQVGCAIPLGMQSQIIADDQISSSSYLDYDRMPQFARILNDSFWMPNPRDDAPWLQISFDEQMIFSAFVLEGVVSLDVGWIWIDEFYFMYGNDLMLWKPYKYFEHNGKCGDIPCYDTSLETHQDEVTVFVNEHPCRRLLVFRQQFKANHLRFYPVVSSKSDLERLKTGCQIEVLGCVDNDCDYSLGVASGGITNIEMHSSSSFNTMYTADSARLRLIADIGSQGSGWIPDTNDPDPWLQANLADLYIIRSIVTQGCGNQMAWVEEFCLSYVDEQGMDRWYAGLSNDECKVFTGNKDSERLIRIDLSPEIEAIAIRIHPKKSFVQPCLRIEIIGCAAGVKRCEIDHLASCEFPRVCTHQTGLISSLGHPGKYPQRSSCTWNIITDQGSYIYLSFINFDIPSLGECDSTSVIVYNGDVESEEFKIDNFCNDRRPPDTILSDYNHILVVLQSGAEDAGSGFIAQYEQHSRVNTTKGSGGVS